jgi:hypothetical protein
MRTKLELRGEGALYPGSGFVPAIHSARSCSACWGTVRHSQVEPLEPNFQILLNKQDRQGETDPLSPRHDQDRVRTDDEDDDNKGKSNPFEALCNFLTTACPSTHARDNVVAVVPQR